MAALWLFSYCQNGVLYGTLYNLGMGTANNISQRVTYEISAVVSPRVLRLKGPNPKRLSLGISRLNPEWPLPDPLTGEKSRIISDTAFIALPPGAMAVFEWPSVLFANMNPFVRVITPPVSEDLEDVEFDVEFSCSVANARKPVDLQHPPEDGKYYVTLYFYSTIPEAWPNYQVSFERQWASTGVTKTRAEALALSGLIPLKDTAGDDARVLPPDLFTGCMALVRKRTGVAEEWFTPGANRMTTVVVVPGLSWATTLDINEWITADTETIRILYRPEALAGDSFRMPHYSSCALSQVDRSGSYLHGSNRRCMDVSCSGFANYADECWQPGADKFSLGTNKNSYGAGGAYLPTDPFDTDPWSYIWSRSSGYVMQGLPGVSSYRNFWYVRLSGGGPSVQELLGGFADELYAGYFATAYPIFLATLGVRSTGTNSAGATQTITYGAHIARTLQNCNGTPATGSLATAVSGWDSRWSNPLGVVWVAKLGTFPRQRSGKTSLRTYVHSGDGRATYCQLSSGVQEVYATNLSRADVDETLADEIRARFA
jgi:hypothetical protein